MDDECWLCNRITPQIVLKATHDLWIDRKVARAKAFKAMKFIREAYRLKPTFFCNKTKAGILSGLFYLLGLECNEQSLDAKNRLLGPFPHINSQKAVSQALGCTDVLVRRSYLRWLRGFPTLFVDFKCRNVSRRLQKELSTITNARVGEARR